MSGCGSIECANECGGDYTWATCPHAQKPPTYDELAETLRPFAEAAGAIDAKLVLGNDIDHWQLNSHQAALLTLGNLRRARAAFDKVALPDQLKLPSGGTCALCGGAPVNEKHVCATCQDELQYRLYTGVVVTEPDGSMWAEIDQSA
jgi:hypothetical protein